MKVSAITLAQYGIKCLRPNNFKVTKIDYILNSISIKKQNIETWSIMESDSSTITIKDEPKSYLPIISPYKNDN